VLGNNKKHSDGPNPTHSQYVLLDWILDDPFDGFSHLLHQSFLLQNIILQAKKLAAPDDG
jgi:hypothetical protein